MLVFGLFDAEDNMEGLDEDPEGEPGPADQYNDGQAGDDGPSTPFLGITIDAARSHVVTRQHGS